MVNGAIAKHNLHDGIIDNGMRVKELVSIDKNEELARKIGSVRKTSKETRELRKQAFQNKRREVVKLARQKKRRLKKAQFYENINRQRKAFARLTSCCKNKNGREKKLYLEYNKIPFFDVNTKIMGCFILKESTVVDVANQKA
uniref:Uncharacterized protein n=1 Tax=Megaselia scalaris TaxID=36166 RepID=T1GWX9_MEGSC